MNRLTPDYSLQLNGNKKIKAASPTTTHENAAVLKSGETASTDSISSSGKIVNGKSSLKRSLLLNRVYHTSTDKLSQTAPIDSAEASKVLKATLSIN